MKKYTLEQLKAEKIAVHIPTQKIYDALMKKFKEYKIGPMTNILPFDKGANCLDLFYYPDEISRASVAYNVAQGYTIITPDQIDWGEDKQAEAGQVTINGGITPPTDWKITTTLIYPPKQDNTPLVFSRAQKDWNAFKSFVKEIEAHGRTLTSAQLKAYMAKERKLRGIK